MAVTAAQMLANWQAGMQQGGNKWNQGVQGYNGPPPGQMAAAEQQKMVNNWTNVVTSGVWAQRVSAVTSQDWKTACSNAVQKFAMGAQKGAKKYNNFAQKAIPIYAQMKAAAKSAVGPIAKVTAALQILLAAGKKQGGNAFA